MGSEYASILIFLLHYGMFANMKHYKDGFIITRILHQIIMFSNKVKLLVGQNNDPPPIPHQLKSYWINELTIK